MEIQIDDGDLANMDDEIRDLRHALGSALEWLQRLEPYFVNEPSATDRDREKLRQVIEWIEAFDEC